MSAMISPNTIAPVSAQNPVTLSMLVLLCVLDARHGGGPLDHRQGLRLRRGGGPGDDGHLQVGGDVDAERQQRRGRAGGRVLGQHRADREERRAAEQLPGHRRGMVLADGPPHDDALADQPGESYARHYILTSPAARPITSTAAITPRPTQKPFLKSAFSFTVRPWPCPCYP